MSEESAPYTRVNGDMLHSFRGKNVSLLGKFSSESPDGMSFELISPDNKSVQVKLKVPIKETLNDFVEVYGNVDERGNINCINYTTFDSSITKNFGIIKFILLLSLLFKII